eukprot:251076_1
MSEGVVTTATVISFSVNTFFLISIIALSVKSIRTTEDVWKGSKTNKNIQILTITTLSLYASAVFVSWIFYLEIMTIGYDVDTFDVIPTLTLLLFTILFATGLIVTLIVWIKRAQCAFQSTEYEFSSSFLKFVQLLFWAICILGGCTVILYAVTKVTSLEILLVICSVLGGIFVLLFVTEVLVILYAHCKKLRQLKMRCEAVVRAFDRSVADTMTKLTALQIKLSILLGMMILGTFVCVFAATVLGDHIQFLFLTVNAFIGFICLYCSMPGHRSAYRQMCGMCLWCCKRYAHSYDELMVLSAMSHGKLVKSKSTSDVATVDTKRSVGLTSKDLNELTTDPSKSDK